MSYSNLVTNFFTCCLIFLLSPPIFKSCNSNFSQFLILYKSLTFCFSLDSIHS